MGFFNTIEPALPPITTWSPSRLLNFEQCPHRVWLQAVKKEPELPPDESSPLLRGERIHKLAEDYIQHKTDTFPPEYKKAQPQLTRLRELYPTGRVKVEEQWGVNLLWEPVDWFAPTVWGRVKLDVFLYPEDPENEPGEIIDWKTGKSWMKQIPHITQLMAYSVISSHRFPELKEIKATMEYVDEGRALKQHYTQSSLPAIRSRLQSRALSLTTALDFPAKPNKGNCRWCPFGGNVGTSACDFYVE